MTTQEIHGGLTLVQIHEAKNNRSALWLVKRGEVTLGFLEKYKNTKTTSHPWKAYKGRGLSAQYLGAFYEIRNFCENNEGINFGGKNAAIDAIVNAEV